MLNITITKAKIEDLLEISQFADFWLSGRGIKNNAPGAVNDYFISPGQHKKYISKYQTWLARYHGLLVGWAVIQHDGSMIHLLISGYYRGQGLGTAFLNAINPKKIHSKSDQSSGNPEPFYVKNGYIKTDTVKSKSRIDIDKIKPNRKPNIDIFERKDIEKLSLASV